MEEKQFTEVRNYLLSKNLPIDILIEVEDHFLTQMNEILKNGGTDFNGAFYKVKVLWEKELSFPKYNLQFYLSDVTFFVRKISRNLFKEMLRISLLYSFYIFIFIFSSALFLTENSFGYYSLILLIMIYISPLIVYLKYFREFKLARQYDQYILTYYQRYNLLLAGGAGAFGQILFRYRSEASNDIYRLLEGHFSWYGFWTVFGCFGLIVWSVFNIISQKKYLHQIRIVKPYLKYLRTSA